MQSFVREVTVADASPAGLGTSGRALKGSTPSQPHPGQDPRVSSGQPVLVQSAPDPASQQGKGAPLHEDKQKPRSQPHFQVNTRRMFGSPRVPLTITWADRGHGAPTPSC